MASFNKVILIGNLTREPETRTTPKGTAICTFGLAVNRKYKDESGGLREEVNFFDIEAWGKTAETISKYMRKGSPLFIEGRLKYDSWEDKNTNQKRSRVKIIVETAQFIGSPRGDSAPAPADNGDDDRSVPPPRAPRPAPAAPPPAQENIDEDVPF
ncbi:MAG: single-stranded DNA-binding protein [Opitutaceae bacterium]|jgi:single-strand DNA-binding protein|nr:single-stranded DNA-binding protein [Opitutaceae bacterium]